MWCIVTNSTCSCSPTRSSFTRTSGPRLRSNPFSTSSFTRLLTSSSTSSLLLSSPAPPLLPLTSSTSTPGHPLSSITCHGSPSSSSNRVRNTSCLLHNSSIARSTASTRSSPSTRIPNGMLYVPRPGSICSINHNRCCANDSGSFSPLSLFLLTSLGLSTSPSPAPLAPPSPPPSAPRTMPVTASPPATRSALARSPASPAENVLPTRKSLPPLPLPPPPAPLPISPPPSPPPAYAP